MKVSWPHIAVAAFAMTMVSLPAVAQTAGPGGAYYGAGSGPQSGSQPAAVTATGQPAKRALYNSTSPVAPAGSTAGPGGAYFGALSGPQSGSQPAATTESRGRSASNAAPQQPGSAGPSGNNYGAASNPQTGR
jgi:hypothetical protein